MKRIIRLTESELHNVIAESVKRILGEDIDGDNHIFEVQDITPDMLEHLWVFETGDSYYEFEANYGWVTFRGVYASDGLHVDEVIIGHSGAGRQMDNRDLQSEQFEQWFDGTLKDSLTQKVEMKIDNGDFANETNESRIHKTIKFKESDLHKMIVESVKQTLNEGVVESLEQLEQQLIRVAIDIKNVYFKNEAYFDKLSDRTTKFERLGLDNPPYAFGSQGELSLSYDAEKWQELTGGRAQSFEQELQETFKWFNTLKYYAETEGYGAGAASRGFDVTRPIGMLWMRAYNAIKILKQMAEITNTELNEDDRYYR